MNPTFHPDCRELKIALTGSFGVGKTALYNRFFYNFFEQKYQSSIGLRLEIRKMSRAGQEYSISLRDLAGEMRLDNIPGRYFRGADVILLVFDPKRKGSYQSLEADVKLLRSKYPEAALKLVCNKIDLLTTIECETFISSLPVAVDYLTSAKTGKNVQLVFDQLAESFLFQMHPL